MIMTEHFKALGITQKAFALEIGVTPAFVSQFLSGKRLPSSERLSFICIWLRIEPSIQRYLFHLLDYKMPNEHGTSVGNDKIIRFYMEHCYDDESRTLAKCREDLKNKSDIYKVSTHE